MVPFHMKMYGKLNFCRDLLILEKFSERLIFLVHEKFLKLVKLHRSTDFPLVCKYMIKDLAMRL